MISKLAPVDPTMVVPWLEARVRPFLKPDVSNYAKGRMRAWIGTEPSLHRAFPPKPGIDVSDEEWAWLQGLLAFPFDYALVTWSGAEATGILPHRDAGYAAPVALGWNLSGTCRFDYFEEETGSPSHSLALMAGDVIRFDCKKRHAAQPSANRWGMNLWRAKP